MLPPYRWALRFELIMMFWHMIVRKKQWQCTV